MLTSFPSLQESRSRTTQQNRRRPKEAPTSVSHCVAAGRRATAMTRRGDCDLRSFSFSFSSSLSSYLFLMSLLYRLHSSLSFSLSDRTPVDTCYIVSHRLWDTWSARGFLSFGDSTACNENLEHWCFFGIGGWCWESPLPAYLWTFPLCCTLTRRPPCACTLFALQPPPTTTIPLSLDINWCRLPALGIACLCPCLCK